MKHTARIISLILVLMMALSVFAGCSPKESTPDAPASSKAPEASKAPESKEEDKPAAPEFKMPWEGEEVVLKGFGYDSLVIGDTACTRAWNEACGNLRVEWDFIPYSDYLTKTQVFLASNDVPDILPVNDVMKVSHTYGATGTLLDFNKYAEYMPNLAEYRKTYKGLDYICTKDNERFAIIGVQPIDFAGENWFVNMDELKEAGVEKLPENVDELLAAMRQVKKADPTSIPFVSYWNIGYTMNNMARLFNAQLTPAYYDTKAGKYEFTFSDENAARRKALVEFMHTCFEEGLINPEIATASFDQEMALMGAGNWAFQFVYTNSPEKEIFKVKAGEKLPYDIHPMLPPVSADGNRYLPIAYQNDGIPGWGIVCSAETEHPELLAAYMDLVVSPFGRDNFNYGVEGVTFDYKDGVPVMRDGIDKSEYGVGTNYEVYMIGMGPIVRTGEGWLVAQETIDMDTKALADGTIKADFNPVHTMFSAEAAEEKASIENILNTYVNEQEALFIYGQRDLSEWDAFVEEVKDMVDADRLVQLYSEADTIVRSEERVFVAK